MRNLISAESIGQAYFFVNVSSSQICKRAWGIVITLWCFKRVCLLIAFGFVLIVPHILLNIFNLLIASLLSMFEIL